MHKVALNSLHIAEGSAVGRFLIHQFGSGGNRVTDPRLQCSIGGLNLDNPTIVAAGWDKQGKAVRGLWELGFGAVEIGSVLEFAQPGNPKPRQFILAPGVALNSLGFNSEGMEAVCANISRYKNLNIPLGVNIGKNKEIADKDAPRAYAIVAKRLYSEASYFVINVSSPNTPGLRKLQDKPQLLEIISAINESCKSCGPAKPTFVKIAPDLSKEAVDDVVDLVLTQKLSGIVATNTTNNSEIKAGFGEKWRDKPGGVSGDSPEYRKMSTEIIAHIYRSTNGAVEIMGCGGIKDGITAWEKIKAGAKAIQILTAIRGEGPSVARTICLELLALMDRAGVKSLSEVLGVEA